LQPFGLTKYVNQATDAKILHKTCNLNVKLYYQLLHLTYLCNFARY